MANEELIDKIVKRCAGPISIFLGAGASMPIGLPDMVSFWENAYGNDFFKNIGIGCDYTLFSKNKLNGEQVIQNKSSMIRRLIQTASIGKEKISCDLEELFAYIHSCPILSSSLANLDALKKTFYLYHTCSNHSTYEFNTYVKQYNPFRANIETWINDAFGCIEEFRHKLYDSYLIDDSGKWESNISEAVNCYTFLLKLPREGKFPVIFTTNYDTVFDALEVTEKLKDLGFRLQNGTKLNPNKHRYFFSLDHYLDESENQLLSVILFRMHGSVAWERKGKNIEDHFPNKHSSRAEIVEPVISKKLPETEPFRGMYDIFKKTLHNNKVLLSIGFSFRDDAIRNIVEEVLKENESFHVICVAPPCEKVPELDQYMGQLQSNYDSRFIWLREKFGTPETEKLILEKVHEIIPR